MSDLIRQDCFALVGLDDEFCNGKNNAEGPCPHFEDCKKATKLSGGVQWKSLNKSQKMDIETSLAAPVEVPTPARSRPGAAQEAASVPKAVVPASSDVSIEDAIDAELGDLGIGGNAPPSVAPLPVPAVSEPPKKKKGRGRPKKNVTVAEQLVLPEPTPVPTPEPTLMAPEPLSERESTPEPLSEANPNVLGPVQGLALNSGFSPALEQIVAEIGKEILKYLKNINAGKIKKERKPRAVSAPAVTETTPVPKKRGRKPGAKKKGVEKKAATVKKSKRGRKKKVNANL